MASRADSASGPVLQAASETAGTETGILERRGCRLRYWVGGPEDGTPVVLSHGFTMDHQTFAPQIRALCRRYRTVWWDIRGHGRSRPMGEPFSVATAAADLLALLDHLEIDRAALVGHSLGGYISQELELRHPERVAALAMISTTCLTFEQPRVLRLGGPLTRALLQLWPDRLTTRQIGWIGGLGAAARAHAREASERIPKAERCAIWAAILAGYHHEPGYRIRCPLLIMHGRWDWLVGAGLIPALAPRWIEREPGCRFEIIPGAAHVATLDNPDFTNRALLEFLGESAGLAAVTPRTGQPR